MPSCSCVIFLLEIVGLCKQRHLTACDTCVWLWGRSSPGHHQPLSLHEKGDMAKSSAAPVTGMSEGDYEDGAFLGKLIPASEWEA